MEDLVHAIMMAFSVLVFVIALSVVVYMFQQATSTAENILYYSDETNYYDNVEFNLVKDAEGNDIYLTNRVVDIDTIITTLYRYYKENFCVKIYDAPSGDNTYGNLLHVFDVNLEGKVRSAAAMSTRTGENLALHKMYNDKDGVNKSLYLFEAPWIGSTDEDMKKRIDYFINGDVGYINNTLVDYTNNKFYNIRKYNKNNEDKIYFKEDFVRYTYTGDTIQNDEGEILVEGSMPEDKIIITYTATRYENII